MTLYTLTTVVKILYV